MRVAGRKQRQLGNNYLGLLCDRKRNGQLFGWAKPGDLWPGCHDHHRRQDLQRETEGELTSASTVVDSQRQKRTAGDRAAPRCLSPTPRW